MDYVKIKKPPDDERAKWPVWPSFLDPYDGLVVPIKSEKQYAETVLYSVAVANQIYWLRPEWCEHVDKPLCDCPWRKVLTQGCREHR